MQWLICFGLFAGTIALGILPPLLSNAGVDIATQDAANIVQVQQRLSHHLLFQNFPALHVGRFAFLIAVWLLITRTVFISRKFQRLAWFCNGSLVVSLAGVMLSGLIDMPNFLGRFSNAMLRFYWFRFSDFAIPLGLSLVGIKLFRTLFRSKLRSQRLTAWFSSGLFALAMILVVAQSHTDPRAEADKAILPTYIDQPLRTFQSYENWRKVCFWVMNNTRSDSVFVTPMQQQTFKWYAHRAEFACWKDMPQDARSLMDWSQRISILRGMQQIPGGPLGLSDEQVEQLVGEYGVTHLLVLQGYEDFIGEPVSEKLTRIYPTDEESRSTYVVYRINGQ